MESLKQIIDNQLSQATDPKKLRALIVSLAELADSKGATEAEMKEIFKSDLEVDAKASQPSA